ncbi:hypothetical protein BDZ89DRAFT_472035 [Hymenopellis radicata]|nr:hypothetical protein BDZ89DRAFT_472035 [Hymenopellis radicata]
MQSSRCLPLLSLCLPGSRRYATLIPDSAKRALQATYAKDRYPDNDQLERLAQELGEDRLKLSRWFIRQRASERALLKASGVEEPWRAPNLTPNTPQLEAAFQDCPYPDAKKKTALSRKLSLPMLTIEQWFINRRTAEKKYRRQARLTMKGLILNTPIRKVKLLEEHFHEDMYPSSQTLTAFSHSLWLRKQTVRNWFNARRKTERRRRAEAGLEVDLRAFPLIPPLPASKPHYQRHPPLRADVSVLEERFAQDPDFTTSKVAVDELAQELGITSERIIAWFYKRRKKKSP